MIQLSLSKVSLKKKQRKQLLVVCGGTQCCTVAQGTQTRTRDSRNGLLNAKWKDPFPGPFWFYLLPRCTAGSHSICCLPGRLCPFLQSCFRESVPDCTVVQGCLSTTAGLWICFWWTFEAPVSPFLQLVQVTLNSSCYLKLGVTHKLAENTLHPIIQAINEDSPSIDSWG